MNLRGRGTRTAAPTRASTTRSAKFDDCALEIDRMAAVWPAQAAMPALVQVCVHECNCGHKSGCPLLGAIVSDSYPGGKTAVGGRLRNTRADEASIDDRHGASVTHL